MSIRLFYLLLPVCFELPAFAEDVLLPPGPPAGLPLAAFTGLAVLFQRVQPLLPVPLPVPPPLLFATISLHPVFCFHLACIYLTISCTRCQVSTPTACRRTSGRLLHSQLFIREYGNYFGWIYPSALSSSAISTAPPAAPLTVLWDKLTNL